MEENTAAKFTCSFGGAPESDVSWFRLINSFGEVQKIGNEGKITSAGKSSTLTIDPVDYKDAGMYLCKANNSVGEGNAAGTLVVKCEYVQYKGYIYCNMQMQYITWRRGFYGFQNIL